MGSITDLCIVPLDRYWLQGVAGSVYLVGKYILGSCRLVEQHLPRLLEVGISNVLAMQEHISPWKRLRRARPHASLISEGQ
jgi:hypothetical protein